ncbi:MAG: CCA tRNA nucleotidyltransferase [Bryobacter sp.]|nr:CCA tRNA nucleotidyltransferase [Bryobacter sp.]
MPDSPAAHFAHEILAQLRAQGHSAYWVGGCVRDLHLGLPIKDFDIATSARPEAVLALFPHSELVGASFGVVLVKQPGLAIEVATYRSEDAYHDGRRPSLVQYETEPARDAARRDFTINALFHDPFTGATLDFHGGLGDLRTRTLRAVGNPAARFAEDHLRLLRAVRFAARFSFTIEPQTAAAIQAHAPSLARISAERIRVELNRILTEGAASHGLRLLDELGLLAVVLPEVKALQGVAQPPEFHPEGDVWTHTLLMLDLLTPPLDPVLAWGVLLHDIGKPVTQTITDRIRFNGHVEAGLRIAEPLLGRLRFSADDTERILALVQHHMRFMELPRMKLSTQKRFLRLPYFDQHLELHRVDCTSAQRGLDNYQLAQRLLREMPPEVVSPPPLVRGQDVLALGVPPGPRIRALLAAVEEAQLEGSIEGREEALALLARLAATPSTTP